MMRGHDVFTDKSNIQIGSVWSSVIENNISDCDIFIAIVTHAALKSPNVEKEVLQAQEENKIIVPCMHKYVMSDQIKWNLTNLQGLEFKTEYDLAREMTRNLSLLYEKTRQKTTREASNFGRKKQVTTETVGSRPAAWWAIPHRTSSEPPSEVFCPSCRLTLGTGFVSTGQRCPICNSSGIRYKLLGDP